MIFSERATLCQSLEELILVLEVVERSIELEKKILYGRIVARYRISCNAPYILKLKGAPHKTPQGPKGNARNF